MGLKMKMVLRTNVRRWKGSKSNRTDYGRCSTGSFFFSNQSGINKVTKFMSTSDSMCFKSLKLHLSLLTSFRSRIW